MSIAPLGAEIESYLPGRVRVRLPKEHRQPDRADGIRRLLEDVEGIRNVAINVATGSVLVEYDPTAIEAERLIALGRAANIIADQELRVSGNGHKHKVPRSATSEHIVGAIRGLDRTISDATEGALDLKLIVPLGFLTLSAIRLISGAERRTAPWYVLAWYGYSMFMHWNQPLANGLSEEAPPPD